MRIHAYRFGGGACRTVLSQGGRGPEGREEAGGGGLRRSAAAQGAAGALGDRCNRSITMSKEGCTIRCALAAVVDCLRALKASGR